MKKKFVRKLTAAVAVVFTAAVSAPLRLCVKKSFSRDFRGWLPASGGPLRRAISDTYLLLFTLAYSHLPIFGYPPGGGYIVREWWVSDGGRPRGPIFVKLRQPMSTYVNLCQPI